MYKAFYRLSKAGIPYEFLGEKSYELFDSILDAMGFHKYGMIYEKDGKTGETSRDYLTSYFLDEIEYEKPEVEKTAEEVYEELKRMWAEQELFFMGVKLTPAPPKTDL